MPSGVSPSAPTVWLFCNVSHIYINTNIFILLYVSVFRSVCLSCLSVCLYVCLSVSVCLSVCVSGVCLHDIVCKHLGSSLESQMPRVLVFHTNATNDITATSNGQLASPQ